MAIADRLRSLFGFEKKALTLTDPAIGELFGAIPTRTGLSIGPASAMRVPAVACATALISETVGALPVKLYDRASKTAASSHPAYKLLHDEANEWTAASGLRTALTLDALLTDKGGFAHVTRLDDGTPYELHRLDPQTVNREIAPDGEPFFEVRTDAGVRRFPHTDILHIQSFAGVSPITLAREAIALAAAFEAHMAGVFANGGRPSGVILAKKPLDVEAKRRIAGSWFTAHGRQNAGGTAILDEEMDYKQISMTLADAQFAENRLEQIREIARAFRVPPTMLFELTRGTWSNTEEMARQFYSVTLKPWLESWQWAYARCLLTPAERRRFYLEFVVDDLLTTNAAARAEAYGKYRAMGALTANEVRAGLNLPGMSGGDELQNPFTSSGKAADA